ncbi:GGDEF domain-containing protein [Martelella soudanensis]|uniref:GGDEF domain-containing protein n=1 Tax=unclassified Martelella TaxID=2629616 RepID=UPI0015DF330D|nr:MULTISPECIES: diguanylate cyclase [unclassified Martelella]
MMLRRVASLSSEDQLLDEQIELNLRKRGALLRFTRPLERRFVEEMHHNRHRQLVWAGIIGVLVIAAFALVDVIYREELLGRMTLIRTGVVLVLLSALTVLVMRDLDTRLPGWISVFGVAVSAIGAGLMLTTPGNPIVQFEPYTFLLLAIVGNIALPLRTSQAVVAAVVNFAIAAFFILPLETLHPMEKASPLIFLGATSLLTLLASYRIESIERKVFLLYLREKVYADTLYAKYRSLNEISNTDALTELANRRLFDDFLKQSWTAAAAAEQPVAMLMIDIDHFKGYNDTYGHPAGDECLKRVAAALKASSRSDEDLPARFGGEEFALVLPNGDEDSALALGARIHEAMAALAIPHAASPTKTLSVSIGIAVERPATTPHDPRNLLIRADRALYAAKRAGRNCTRIDVSSEQVPPGNPAERLLQH